MTKIKKGKKPEVNLDSELDQPQAGFKVTLQKPSKKPSEVSPEYPEIANKPVRVKSKT